MWNGEEVEVNGITIRRGVRKGQYFVPSSSSVHVYEIDIIAGTHLDCQGFKYRNTCRHWEACKQDYNDNCKLSEDIIEKMQSMSGQSIGSFLSIFTEEQLDDAITQGFLLQTRVKYVFI